VIVRPESASVTTTWPEGGGGQLVDPCGARHGGQDEDVEEDGLSVWHGGGGQARGPPQQADPSQGGGHARAGWAWAVPVPVWGPELLAAGSAHGGGQGRLSIEHGGGQGRLSVEHGGGQGRLSVEQGGGQGRLSVEQGGGGQGCIV
jgi:hypothetical protein